MATLNLDVDPEAEFERKLVSASRAGFRPEDTDR